MMRCGCYIPYTDLEPSDCAYRDDRCCFYCDAKDVCIAKAKCSFDCWDDNGDNPDDVNAYDDGK